MLAVKGTQVRHSKTTLLTSATVQSACSTRPHCCLTLTEGSCSNLFAGHIAPTSEVLVLQLSDQRSDQVALCCLHPPADIQRWHAAGLHAEAALHYRPEQSLCQSSLQQGQVTQQLSASRQVLTSAIATTCCQTGACSCWTVVSCSVPQSSS